MLNLKSFDDVKRFMLYDGTNLIIDGVRYIYAGEGRFIQCGYEEVRENAIMAIGQARS